MGKNNYKRNLSSYNRGQGLQRSSELGRALTDITSSDKPGKWVTGIGLGALIIAGLAIKTISSLSDRR